MHVQNTMLIPVHKLQRDPHLVWMILRNSCPERGLKMKMAPLMGFVVRLPSNVLWIVTLRVRGEVQQAGGVRPSNSGGGGDVCGGGA